MKISIIIVNYNSHNLTIDCLTSLISFCDLSSSEIIVVDNGSSEPGLKKLIKNFSEVNFIQNNKNLGFSKAVNVGIRHSKGEYILLLNNDVYFTSDILKKPLNTFNENSEIGIVTIKCKYPDNRVQVTIGSFPSILRDLHTLFFLNKILSEKLNKKLFPTLFPDMNKTQEVDFCWGTYFMFKKSILKTLNNNKLNDDFFMYAEDLVWCYQFKKNGFKIKFLADVSIFHIHGGSSNINSFNKEMFVLNKLNELKFIYTTMPILKFVSMLAIRVIWNLIVALKHKKHRLILKTYFNFLFGPKEKLFI